MLGWVFTLGLAALVVGLLGFFLIGGIIANLFKLLFLLLLALIVIGLLNRFIPRQSEENDLPDGDGQGAG